MDFLDQIQWNDQGLVPVIAQEHSSGDVLMLAWMNRQALRLTCQTKRAVYYSRSRARLWFKGEESGHTHEVLDIRLDCDGDVLLLKVVAHGHVPSISCHTGRHSCFYRQYQDSAQGARWTGVAPVLKEPAAIYRNPA